MKKTYHITQEISGRYYISTGGSFEWRISPGKLEIYQKGMGTHLYVWPTPGANPAVCYEGVYPVSGWSFAEVERARTYFETHLAPFLLEPRPPVAVSSGTNNHSSCSRCAKSYPYGEGPAICCECRLWGEVVR